MVLQATLFEHSNRFAGASFEEVQHSARMRAREQAIKDYRVTLIDSDGIVVDCPRAGSQVAFFRTFSICGLGKADGLRIVRQVGLEY